MRLDQLLTEPTVCSASDPPHNLFQLFFRNVAKVALAHQTFASPLPAVQSEEQQGEQVSSQEE